MPSSYIPAVGLRKGKWKLPKTCQAGKLPISKKDLNEAVKETRHLKAPLSRDHYSRGTAIAKLNRHGNTQLEIKLFSVHWYNWIRIRWIMNNSSWTGMMP